MGDLPDLFLPRIQVHRYLSRFSHIFFDLDHTLWDFETNSRQTISEAIEHFGLEVNPKNFIPVYERLNEHYWGLYREGKIEKAELRIIRFSKTFEKFDINDEVLTEDFCSFYIEEGPKKKTLFPNAIEVLDSLKETHEMHLISNGFKEVQSVKLAHSGLDKYFEKPIISEDVGVKKPHPDIFHFAMSSTGSEPDSSMMVGDNMEADIKGAHAVGMTTVHFNPHNHRHNFKPHHVINDLKEILELV